MVMGCASQVERRDEEGCASLERRIVELEEKTDELEKAPGLRLRILDQKHGELSRSVLILNRMLASIRSKTNCGLESVLNEGVKDRDLYCGHVTDVHRVKRYVRIDRGAEHGIRLGMTFTVFDNSAPKEKARVVVTEVWSAVSQCKIIGSKNIESRIERFDRIKSEKFISVSCGRCKTLFVGLFGAKNSEDVRENLKRKQSKKGKTGPGNESHIQMSMEELELDIKALARQSNDLYWILKHFMTGPLRIPVERTDPAMVPRVSGKVVGVGKKHEFVVIDIGEEDGVKVGFQMTIHRGLEYIAKMVIKRVYPNQSAGKVIEMTQKSRVRIGDKVLTRAY